MFTEISILGFELDLNFRFPKFQYFDFSFHVFGEFLAEFFLENFSNYQIQA